jgi:hypothetical protein
MSNFGSRRGAHQNSAGGSFYSPNNTGFSGGGADFSYSFGGTDDQQFESFDYNNSVSQQQPATVPSTGFYDPGPVSPPSSQSYASPGKHRHTV